MDAVVDRFVVRRAHEKAIKAGIAATLLVGDGLLQVHVAQRARRKADARAASTRRSAAPTHHFVYGDIGPDYFVFNNPESACRTCGGLGVDKLTHPELLIPDPTRSILGGCFVREAFKYNPDTWDGRMMYSLSKSARISRSTRRGRICPKKVRRTPSSTASSRARFDVTSPPDAKVKRDDQEGKEVGFGGIARRIERYYRRYRQRGEANSRHGSVARQGDGRAHLSRLQRRARPRRRGCCSPSTARASTMSGSSTSTSCTHSSARSSRPAAAPTRAGRCVEGDSRRGWICCSASGSTISTSIAAPARSPAASRSASGCRRRSAPG